MPLLDRITFDPMMTGGRACIRGMRVTVTLVLNLLANGMSDAEIIDAYPYLEVDVGWVSAQRVTQQNQDVGLRPTA
jgi:uncharacterized protein (DUF433 family)